MATTWIVQNNTQKSIILGMNGASILLPNAKATLLDPESVIVTYPLLRQFILNGNLTVYKYTGSNLTGVVTSFNINTTLVIDPTPVVPVVPVVQIIPTAQLGSGIANSTTYLRGDQTWSTITTGVVAGVTTGNGLSLSHGTLSFSGASYSPAVGSSNITTVGTIGIGTWAGNVISPVYGGSGVANNAASTLTISGNFGTTLTVSGPTTLTLPTSGTLLTTTGSGASLTDIPESAVTNLTTDLAAKSPIAGSSSIGTVGTITSGVWNGTAIAAANTSGLLPLVGGTMVGNIAMGGHNITGAGIISGTNTIEEVTLTVDGGGSPINNGNCGFRIIDAPATIVAWTILADVSGSVTIDIQRSTYSGFPGSLASLVGGGTRPYLSSMQKNQTTTISGWTSITLLAGDILEFIVSGASTCTRVQLFLKLQR